jgi:protein-S-isoprenylcysteine O-methyltransferase Ste14
MTETLNGDRRPRLLDLAASIPRQVSRLVRDELRAAQAELATKLKAAGVGAGILAGALVLLLFAINALLAAAILGLAMVLPAWLSALLVGVVLAIIAAVLALIGVRKLKAGVPPVPEESIDSVKEDIRTVKGTISHDG